MAKTRFIGIAAGLILGFSAFSQALGAPEDLTRMATPPQPTWSDLSVKQKIILAPLCDSWDSLEYYRQKKWLGLVNRFSTLSPQEQRRIQEQMREWNALSPEQQQEARKNYKTVLRLSREKRQEFKRKWAEYVRLPESEKKKFLQGEPLENLRKRAPQSDDSQASETPISEATP